MLSASEEALFRSIEKRAKEPYGHVYRHHPVDLYILMAFVLAIVLIFSGFYYLEIRFPLGGYLLPRVVEKLTDTGNETNATSNETSPAGNESITSAIPEARIMRMGPPGAELSVNIGHQQQKPEAQNCTDASCVKLSNYILASLNKRVNPCDNFYEYVCSKHTNASTLAPGEAVTSESTRNRKQMEQSIIKLIKAAGDSLGWHYAAWHKCVTNQTKTSGKAFRSILEEQGLEQFPFTRAPVKLAAMAANIHRMSGVSPLFDVGVGRIDNKNVLKISPPNDLLLRDFVTAHRIHKDWYETAVQKVAGDASLPELFQVEKRIAELTRISSNSNGGHHKLKIGAMPNTPKWYWKEYFKTLLAGIKNVTTSDVVLVEDPTYFAELNKFLAKVDAKDLANFLGFYVYLAHAPLLDSRKYHAISQIAAALKPGWFPEESNEVICLRLFSKLEPLGYIYRYWQKFKEHLDHTTAKNLVQNGKNTILNTIEGISWLPATFKNKFEERLANLTAETYFPAWLADDMQRKQFIKTITNHVHYSGINVFNPVVKEIQHRKLQYLNSDEQPWLSGLMEQDPILVKNRLEIPMAMFDLSYDGDAFWMYHLPRAGYKILGKIVKAYIRTLKKLQQPIYNATLPKLEECVAKQYYAMRENGSKTQHLALDQDVVDQFALPLAYDLYMYTIPEHNNIVLPNLRSFSIEQIFFINFALSRCEHYEVQYYQQLLENGRQTPAAWRVNGPLQNSEEFAKAFHCQPTSYMAPSDKCKTWNASPELNRGSA